MKLVKGYLGPDLQLEGSLSCKDSIRIDGSYVGSITSKHMVIVGDSGKVKGQIEAPVIRVDGWVEGNLKATKLVELMGKAKIKGNIITCVGGLNMRIGSEFEGEFMMKSAD
jgi:cytoskeletal protein CcmA (bactofilin family)